MKLLGRNKKAVDATEPKDEVKPETKNTEKPIKEAKEVKQKKGFFGRKKADKKPATGWWDQEKPKSKKWWDQKSERMSAKADKAPVVTAPPAAIKEEEPVEEEPRKAPISPHPTEPYVIDNSPTPHPTPKKGDVVPETVQSKSDDAEETAAKKEEQSSPAEPERKDAGERQTESDAAEEAATKEEKPAESEARNEGDAADKTETKASRSREASEGQPEMSVEDPPEENPGLLCGCI